MPVAPLEYIKRAIEKTREGWRHWRTFREIDAGHRYQARYHLHQRRTRKGLVSRYWRPMSLLFGPILIIAGFVFIPTPGPSYIIIAIGLWLLAGEFLLLARIFDKVGVQVGRFWQGAVAKLARHGEGHDRLRPRRLAYLRRLFCVRRLMVRLGWCNLMAVFAYMITRLYKRRASEG